MQIPPTRFGLAWVLAGAVLVGGLVPLFDLIGTPSLLSMLPLLGFGAVASVLVNLVRLFRRDARRRAVVALLISATALASLYAGFRVRWPIRRFMFERLAQRFEPLVHAVERFEREQGRPPATFDEVVPDWIAELPSTQMLECTKVEYAVFDKPNVKDVIRYDLAAPSLGPSRWLPPDAGAARGLEPGRRLRRQRHGPACGDRRAFVEWAHGTVRGQRLARQARPSRAGASRR